MVGGVGMATNFNSKKVNNKKYIRAKTKQIKKTQVAWT